MSSAGTVVREDLSERILLWRASTLAHVMAADALQRSACSESAVWAAEPTAEHARAYVMQAQPLSTLLARDGDVRHSLCADELWAWISAFARVWTAHDAQTPAHPTEAEREERAAAADALRVTMSIARNSVVLCDAQAAAAVYVAETSTYAAHTGTQWKTCLTIC